MQICVARPDAAGVRGAKRNDSLACKVVAFEEGENDFRSLAPPDWITEKYYIVIGKILAFALDDAKWTRTTDLTIISRAL